MSRHMKLNLFARLGLLMSCTGCSRKLDKDETSLRCIRCVNPNATGVIK
ncbi:unnamed protein product [Brassica rapa subsp. trilocularis]